MFLFGKGEAMNTGIIEEKRKKEILVTFSLRRLSIFVPSLVSTTAFANAIVLAQRGECSFAKKGENRTLFPPPLTYCSVFFSLVSVFFCC